MKIILLGLPLIFASLVTAEELTNLQTASVDGGSNQASNADKLYGQIYELMIRNNTKEIEKLLIGGFDINVRSISGNTPLIHASGNGNTDMVKLFLKWKASVNESDHKGRTALFDARNLEIMDILLKNGAEINFINKKGQTVLMERATLSGHENVAPIMLEHIKYLLENGALTDIADKDGKTALILAIENRGLGGTKDIECTKEILKNVRNINKFQQGQKALLSIINDTLHPLHNDHAFMRQMLKMGLKVNEPIGESFLVIASAWYPETLKILVENGANVNLENSEGMTALNFVLDMMTAKILLDAGANINNIDNDGISVLDSVNDSLAYDKDELKKISPEKKDEIKKAEERVATLTELANYLKERGAKTYKELHSRPAQKLDSEN